MKELIEQLRDRLRMKKEQISDKKLLEITKGTFLRAFIEQNLAWRKLVKVIIEEVKELGKRLCQLKEEKK